VTGFTINLTSLGLREAEAALARLSPLDGADLLSGLGRLIREQTVDRLQAGGPSPGGAAFKPNLEGRKPVLFRSGELARSVDYRAGAQQLLVGSSLIYAAIHQFGGTIMPKNASRLAFRIGNRLVFARKVTMPARPYLGLSGEDRSEIVRATALFIRSRIG
jgi:phage gpG-like protein